MQAITTPSSIAAKERVDTLDLLRGVAICGILLMNIPGMGMLWHVGRPPFPAMPDLDWIAYGTQRILFEGSMRGLFTLLFGAGMLVMLRRAERDGDAAPIDVFVRRCLALLFLGLVQAAVFLWPGEILFDYGLTGFFILAFRKARPRTLIATALVLIAAFSLSSIGQAYGTRATITAGIAAEQARNAGKPLTDEQRAAIKARHERDENRNPSPATVSKEIAQRTRWPSVVGWSVGEWAEYNLGWETWFGVLESFCFMLIGMALFRMDVLGGMRPGRLYVRLAVIGYGVGLPIRALSMLWQARVGLGFDFTFAVFSNLAYEPARLLVTLGHVGLLCRLWQAGALGRAWPARALGRMALTTYSLQSILTSILFYGFGMLNRFGFAQLMGIAAIIWIATGAFAVLWLRTHEMGPAEWLLRSVIYGRRGGGVRTEAVPGPDGSLATA